MEAAIRSRRQIVASLTFSAFATVLPFHAGSALARNGHGRGGGDGDSGGRGESGGSGKGGDASNGRGGNNQGNQGRGNGVGMAADAKGSSDAAGRQEGSKADGPTSAGSMRAGRGLSVRHRNGIAEEVNSRGRYVMRDNRGRTIVDRRATKSDRDRLRSFFD